MIAIMAAVLSGAMFFLSQGLANIWALAALAPVPLLWLAYRGTPRWQVAAASFAAFGCGQVYIVQCYWGLIPLGLVAPLELAMCALFPVAVLFAGEARRRIAPVAALFAFPALWTTLEYLIELASPHGTYGSLAYSQVSFPAGIQIASLLGLYAVTFSLCLAANGLALLLRREWLAGATGLSIYALVLIFGWVRLAEPTAAHVRVAALADQDSWHAQNRAGTLDSRLAATEAYARSILSLRGVRVFVIPEGAIQMPADQRTAVLAPLASVARATNAIVVAGTYVPAPPQNRAFAFFPDGRVLTYAKRHPLVPLESEAPGHSLGLLGGGYATDICKDMDFPQSVRATARHGVRLMIVPANDFKRDGWIHARMAVMRGVEDGFAVLRSAFNGLETVSDAQGRLLASASTMRAGMAVTVAQVPLGPADTLYLRIGEIFPWICAALSLALGAGLLGTLAVRRRINAAEPGT